MVYRKPPTLPKLAVSAEIHARVTLAAPELGETVFEFVERALTRELVRARHQVKVNRYTAALREADQANKRIKPMPHEFGLPPDYGSPKA